MGCEGGGGPTGCGVVLRGRSEGEPRPCPMIKPKLITAVCWCHARQDASLAASRDKTEP